MGITVNVKGTEHNNFDGSNRRHIIRRFVRDNILVTLRKDTHNNKTVAVYILAPLRVFSEADWIYR
jgi:hypothetical protein